MLFKKRNVLEIAVKKKYEFYVDSELYTMKNKLKYTSVFYWILQFVSIKSHDKFLVRSPTEKEYNTGK